MTMEDPVTGWFEQCQLYDEPNAYMYQQILGSVWLSRYSRPIEISFDNGSEFKMKFRDLCNNIGLKQCPSKAWDPQSNAILNKLHHVFVDELVTFDLGNNPITVNEDDPSDEYLTAVSYVIRSSYHQTHGHSPAQLVFGKDMFSPVTVNVDCNSINKKKC